MYIHIVQEGETIQSIADSYGVSVNRLVQENGLSRPDQLVIGQSIVITYPEITYTVQEGDTLEGIALDFEVPLLQLLRNNPFLAEREYIYPGETLVIRYENSGKLTTIGYALPFINEAIVRKTLPYLTYLFIYNYRLESNGEIDTFYDDTQTIELAKAYGTMPIMLVTTLTAVGTPNVQTAYEILLNEEVQDKLIDNILEILRTKGYYGFNMTFLYLTESNEDLYHNFTKRVASRLSGEGYLVFISADPRISISGEEISFAKINYANIGREVDGISYISYVWGSNIAEPAPISSITNMRIYLEYVSSMMPPEKIIAGIQIIAYDWEIPYVGGFSKANFLTIASAIDLAREEDVVIQFDERSQTPYFEYEKDEAGFPKQHLVWFIDARTIKALGDLITANQYRGPSVWNIMNYYPQLWLVINSQYEIEKLI